MWALDRVSDPDPVFLPGSGSWAVSQIYLDPDPVWEVGSGSWSRSGDFPERLDPVNNIPDPKPYPYHFILLFYYTWPIWIKVAKGFWIMSSCTCYVRLVPTVGEHFLDVVVGNEIDVLISLILKNGIFYLDSQSHINNLEFLNNWKRKITDWQIDKKGKHNLNP